MFIGLALGELDPNSSDHVVAMTQLKETIASLQKRLQQKDQELLAKDRLVWILFIFTLIFNSINIIFQRQSLNEIGSNVSTSITFGRFEGCSFLNKRNTAPILVMYQSCWNLLFYIRCIIIGCDWTKLWAYWIANIVVQAMCSWDLGLLVNIMIDLYKVDQNVPFKTEYHYFLLHIVENHKNYVIYIK